MIFRMFEEEIIKHAEEKPNEEVCGIIIENNFKQINVVRMNNFSEDKENNFSIPPSEFLKYKIKDKIIGIYHSHTKTTSKPSINDKKCSEECGIPYLIYSLKDKSFFLYYPKSYKPVDIIGRSYIKGFNECTCLFKDYYNKILNINISKWNKNYWLPENFNDANKLLLSIVNKNMKQVNKQNLSKNDLIIFNVNNKRYHVGVYEGGDYFVHQPINGLSRKEMLDERWQSKIEYVYRHNNFV